MASSFGGLEIAKRALYAQRAAIDVTGHNLANASTPGYRRQRAEMVSIPGQQGGLNPGAGVQVAKIERLRDAFVDGQIRRTLANIGHWQARGQVLEEAQEIFKEPSDIGLSAMMDHFWVAWQELSGAALDPGRRNAVLQEGESLAAAFNLASSQLSAMQSEVEANITTILDRVRVTAESIAAMNKEIVRGRVAGENTGDLEDHRDLLVEQLSTDIDISVVESDDGSYNISVGGKMLVSAGMAFAVDATAASTGGAVRGLTEAAKEIIPYYIDQLNMLAVSIMTEVNKVHASGLDLRGAAGGAFFEGTGAADMRLSNAVASDPSAIAASSAPDSPGNGHNALAMAQLKDALTMAGNSASFGAHYGFIVTSLGLDTQEALRSTEVYEGVLEQQQARRDATSGVSQDEELLQLIKYQSAFDAASRLVSVIDEMLDKLINSTGVVGR